jgi:hypothetical protein
MTGGYSDTLFIVFLYIWLSCLKFLFAMDLTKIPHKQHTGCLKLTYQMKKMSIFKASGNICKLFEVKSVKRYLFVSVDLDMCPLAMQQAFNQYSFYSGVSGYTDSIASTIL